MPLEDDVHTLRREVELLKTLLVEERSKNSSSPSPPRVQTQQTFRDGYAHVDPFQRGAQSAPDTPSSARRDSSPRRKASGYSQQVTWQDQQYAQTIDVQHVPVDTKRGKWWLKDRQVLARNVPTKEPNCVAHKVRETWLWSGRTVVVDKVVTCPIPPRDQYHADDNYVEYGQYGGSNRTGDGGNNSSNVSPSRRESAMRPASPAATDARQIAKEFIQQKVTESLSDMMDHVESASVRLEREMSKAAATASTDAQTGDGGKTPRDSALPVISASSPTKPINGG